MRRIRLILGQHTAVARGKLMCRRDQLNSDRQILVFDCVGYEHRVVWGKHPERSDSWFNEDEVQISMACKPYSHDLALQMDICRIRKMRSSLQKGRKNFEYVIDALDLNNPWIAEDQLRISLSSVLAAKLKGS